MADDKLIFDILTGQNTLKKDLSDVSKQVSSLEDDFATVGKTISAAFDAIPAVAAIAAGFELVAKGAELLFDLFKEGIQASAKAEEGIQGLTAALQANGTAFADNVSELTEFAEHIQNTTKFSNDQEIASLGLLRSLTNLNQDGLKVAAQAAADLASVFKVDLQTATELIAKAADGQVTSLKRFGVEVVQGKNNTETFSNALKALSQFQGRAAADADTYSGATKSLGNSFDDLLKVFGDTIVKNPAVIQLFKDTTDAIKDLTTSARDAAPAIRDGIGGAASFLSQALGGITLSALKTRDALSAGQESADKFKDSLGHTINIDDVKLATTSVQQLASAVGDVNEEVTNLFQAKKIKILSPEEQRQVQDFFNNLSKSAATNAEQVEVIDAQQRLRNLDVFKQKELLNNTQIESARALIQDANDKARAKSVIDDFKNLNFTGGLPGLTKLVNDFFNLTGVEAIKAGKAIGQGIGSAISQGAAGANQLFGKAVDAVADIAGNLAQAAGPVAGIVISIVAELLKFFSQGAQIVQQNTKAFLDQAEQIPFNILQSIPAFIIEVLKRNTGAFAVELVNAVPGFITALIDGVVSQLPHIIQDLVSNLPKLIEALITLQPRIAIALISALINELPKLIPALSAAFVQAIIQAGTDFQGQAKGLASGGQGALDSIGSVIGKVGSFLGFADGGIIPGSGSGDHVPILAEPGEAIIPNGLVQRLDNFVTRNSGAGAQQGPMNVTIQVGEQQLAKVMLNLNRQGFRTA